MNLKKIIPSAFILTAFLVLVSCNHDRNHPGWAYMPDMYYSEPYDAYTENPFFADSITMQEPIPGAIARGHIPYHYQAKNYTDQVRAGIELINPIEKNDINLETGKKQYEIFCLTCHGIEGKGDGYLHTSGKFTAKPTSLIDDYVQKKPDGEIFHVITTGSLSGLMGPHGYMISHDDRWRIIHYVRFLGNNY